MTLQEHAFWTFDAPRDNYYDIPSHDELNRLWQKYHCNDTSFVELNSPFLGTCELPSTRPNAVIALDLCEIVRGTATSLARIRGGTLDDLQSNEEGNNFDYGASINGWGNDVSERFISTLVPELMRHDSVEPELYSEAIGAFIRRWRTHGAYVVADTSTMEGCEQDTIRFLAQQYPACFQGILFPRNHDGDGPITKAGALHHALTSASESHETDLTELPVLLIEDIPHHAHGFANTFEDVQVFMPAYPWNTSVDEVHTDITRVTRSLGTIDAFVAADNYLLERGIIA